VMSAAGYFTGREDWRCSRWARAWTVLYAMAHERPSRRANI